MADTGKKANRDLLSSEVKDYDIEQYDIQSILSEMANSGGFESRNLAYGVDILRSMISERNCTTFLSFVGSTISTDLAMYLFQWRTMVRLLKKKSKNA